MCMILEEHERQQREDLFRDYVGQTLWVINSIQHLKTTSKNEMPQYVELAHPEKAAPKQTAEEIKQHLLNKLRG